jgi:hypothetical protein
MTPYFRNKSQRRRILISQKTLISICHRFSIFPSPLEPGEALTDPLGNLLPEESVGEEQLVAHVFWRIHGDELLSEEQSLPPEVLLL